MLGRTNGHILTSARAVCKRHWGSCVQYDQALLIRAWPTVKSLLQPQINLSFRFRDVTHHYLNKRGEKKQKEGALLRRGCRGLLRRSEAQDPAPVANARVQMLLQTPQEFSWIANVSSSCAEYLEVDLSNIKKPDPRLF